MEEKEVKFNEKAKKGLFKGVKSLAKAVMITLGPNGRNVIYDDLYSGIDTTKDGVTVAERFKLEDNLKDMGCQLVKQAAGKTNELAGDGTTTSTLLAYYLIKKGLKIIKEKNCNPVELKRGMDKALEDVIELIKPKSIPIEGDLKKIKNIATISGNNDKSIGELITKAFEEIGDINNIDIAETKTGKTFITTVKGCQFNKGYLSEYFCNNIESKQVEFDNPYIIIYEGKPKNIKDIYIHIQNAQDNPIIFIVEDISDDILHTIISEKLRRKLKIAIVKTPGFGHNKEDKLLDICASIGATLVTKKNSMLEIKMSHYGKAEKVIIDKKGTMIINGGGSKLRVEKRINTLNKKLENAKSIGERDAIKNRIAKLGAGIAVINIGANTPVELKEKKARIIDAIEATKAAIEEGILPGGGIAYIRAAQNVKNTTLTKEQLYGHSILIKTLYKPLKIILENGGENYKTILKTIVESKEYEYGYDAKLRRFGSMYKHGIIDPTKVIRVALENAVSVAGMVLLTECALININNDKQELPEFLQ